MANYIVLMKITTEGAKNLAKEGAKITAGYATLGQYDYVFVIEGPEDIAKVAKCAAAVAMTGATSVETLPALPVMDFFKLVAEI